MNPIYDDYKAYLVRIGGIADKVVALLAESHIDIITATQVLDVVRQTILASPVTAVACRDWKLAYSAESTLMFLGTPEAQALAEFTSKPMNEEKSVTTNDDSAAPVLVKEVLPPEVGGPITVTREDGQEVTYE